VDITAKTLTYHDKSKAVLKYQADRHTARPKSSKHGVNGASANGHRTMMIA
jgi:hypothetical protein